MSYAIYLDGTRMPVNPEEFSTEKSKSTKDYDILNYGKVSVVENAGLDTYKWESEFPAHDYSYCVQWKRPDVYLKLIDDHFKSKEPLELTVSNGTSYGISENVVITSFIKKEIEAGGYQYSITCKQFREPVVVNENINVITRPAPAKPVETVKVNTKTSSIYDAKKKVETQTKKKATIVTPDYQGNVNGALVLDPTYDNNFGEVVVVSKKRVEPTYVTNYKNNVKASQSLLAKAGSTINTIWTAISNFASRNVKK